MSRFYGSLYTRGSTIAEGPRDVAMSVEILFNCCRTVRKNYILKCFQPVTTLMITQGHRNCHYSIGHISLPI